MIGFAVEQSICDMRRCMPVLFCFGLAFLEPSSCFATVFVGRFEIVDRPLLCHNPIFPLYTCLDLKRQERAALFIIQTDYRRHYTAVCNVIPNFFNFSNYCISAHSSPTSHRLLYLSEAQRTTEAARFAPRTDTHSMIGNHLMCPPLKRQRPHAINSRQAGAPHESTP